MLLISILLLLVLFTAAVHIRAEYKGPSLHIYIFKPLTMVFILLIAILGQAAFTDSTSISSSPVSSFPWLATFF